MTLNAFFIFIFLQLTVQQVRTVPRTERAAYVPVVLINLKEGGHLVFSADEILLHLKMEHWTK